MVTSNKPHAVLLASPGMGHLIPVLNLAKRLLTHHSFHVTLFLVTTDSSTAASLTLQQTSNLNSHDIDIVPVPSFDDSTVLGPNPPLEARIGLQIHQSLPFLRSSILSMKLPPSAIIVDLFGTPALPMARDLGMPTYVFFPTSAWLTAVSIYLPFIDKEMEGRHANDQEPLFIPGCDPVRFEDTLEAFLSPGGILYEGYLKAAKEVVAADGVLMNTWGDLEPAATEAVREGGILRGFTKGPVYPIGPLVRSVKGEWEHEVLRWLDGQSGESVMYVSFGSGGMMSAMQTRELALGLEMSGQRFVWVAREPKEEEVDDSSGAFFDAGKAREAAKIIRGLPEGFVTRTEGVGIVVPTWAPQAEILGHPATGGFVTHCGWNSVMESVMNGVPMVAWPLYAEQKMNAFLLAERVGVAVRVGDGVVRREQVAEAVRKVMVGEEGVGLRKRVKELKVSGEKAMSVTGSSHESLCQLRRVCEAHVQGSESKPDHLFSEFVCSCT